MKPIELDKFDPNPYQPETRRDIPEEEVAALAQSIIEVGLIHVPVVREGKDGRYQVADGWRRLAAYKHLVKTDHKYTLMPAEVRELTDRQMADTVLHSAHFRKDLTPIEQAQAYERYLKEFKCTQEEMARRSGISQGELANTVRLLLLPQELQYLVGSGTLPQTHARHFLRLNVLPKQQKELLQNFLKNGMSVNVLDREVHGAIWQNSQSLNPKGESWGRPTFDVTSCKGCEFIAQATEPWGNKRSEQRCVKVECWDKKEEAAQQAHIKEVQADLAKIVKGKKVFTSADLDYNQRADLSDYSRKDIDNPKECNTCDKVVLFKHDLKNPGAPEKVCTNPACMRAKKAKKTRDTNKIKATEDKDLTAQLVPTFQHAHASPRSAVLVIARHIIPRLSAAAKVDLLQAFPDLPKLANHHLDVDQLVVDIENKELDDLLALTVSTIICDSRRASSNYDKYNTKLSAELELDIATLDGTLEKHRAKITAWQEDNCRYCHLAKAALIGTGKDACGQTYNRQLDEKGNCKTGQTAKGKVAESSEKTVKVSRSGAIDPDSTAALTIHALHTNDHNTTLSKTEDGKFFIEEKQKPEGLAEGLAEGPLPCDTCANDGKTCHREHFHAVDGKTGYVCELKVDRDKGKKKKKEDANPPDSAKPTETKTKMSSRKPSPIPTEPNTSGKLDNETKTSKVRSSASPIRRLAPLANGERSKLCEPESNDNNGGKGKKSPGKKSARGASHPIKEQSPASLPAALPITL